MKHTTSLTAALVLLLSGCVDTSTIAGKYEAGLNYRNWEKIGDRNPDWSAMDVECEAFAQRQFPIANVYETSPGYRTDITTSCQNTYFGTTCTSDGGNLVGGRTTAIDVNAGYRQKAYEACYKHKGWFVRDLPPCPIGTVHTDLKSVWGQTPEVFDNNHVCYIPAGDGRAYYKGILISK